jgi:hypothetical protein
MIGNEANYNLSLPMGLVVDGRSDCAFLEIG